MKLRRSEKGLGTVIAAIMFLLISILFVGGTFLWQTTTEAHMNAFEKDRMDEMLGVEASYIYNDIIPPGFFETQLKVMNTGPIDIQIIQVWLIDSDHNAARNHIVDLPEIPYNFRNFKLNIRGFFWKTSGLFDLKGESLQSLLPINA